LEVRRRWPALIIVATYWLLVALILTQSLRKNDGHLVYAIDDPYIHMSMAKHFVRDGVFGVTADGFTSSTSSPVWTFLVAGAFALGGVRDVWPLVLNLLAGSVLLWTSYLFVSAHVRSRVVALLTVSAAMLAAPILTLTMIGMEHVIHTLLTVAFAFLASRHLAGEPRPSFAALLVLAALLCGVRYEGILLVAAVAAGFAWRRQPMRGVALVAAACVLPLAYGLWSLSHGWFLLPNSILMKQQAPIRSLSGVAVFILAAASSVTNNPPMLILIAVALTALIVDVAAGAGTATGRFGSRPIVAALFVICAALHMILAHTGWFYRYEAYLVYFGILVAGLYVEDAFDWIAARTHDRVLRLAMLSAAATLMAFVAAPLALRAGGSFLKTPQATHNLYTQQFQMGRFVNEALDGRAVVLNDIGAVTYLSNFHLVDIWGLGSLDTAALRLRHSFGPEQLDRTARDDGAHVAIVYDMALTEAGGIPPRWRKMAEWTISDNVACADKTVAFYALDESGASALTAGLQAFSPRLPSDVAHRWVK
jgi:hypothetical protein